MAHFIIKTPLSFLCQNRPTSVLRREADFAGDSIGGKKGSEEWRDTHTQTLSALPDDFIRWAD